MLKLKLQYFAYLMQRADARIRLIGKDSDAGKDWGKEEKRETEDELTGWHHWLKGHEFEQTPGDSEGQGRLVCFSPWGCEELDTTEWLNSNNNKVTRILYYLKLSLYWFSTVLVPVNLWLLFRVLTNFIHKKTNKQTNKNTFIHRMFCWTFLDVFMEAQDCYITS